MIEGLQFQIRSDELQTRLLERAKYHQTRAATKEAELPALKESLERIKGMPTEMTAMKMSSSSTLETPIERLEQEIKRHRRSAAFFEFIAGHLFQDVYKLSVRDLSDLELVKTD